MSTTTIKDGYAGGSDNQVKVNSDGSINVNTTGSGNATQVNIHDSLGNPLNSASGALEVTVNDGTLNTNTHIEGLANFQTSQYTVGIAEIQLAASPLANRSSISFKVKTTSG